MNIRRAIFQDLDHLVDNGYADDWNGTGESIYDADPVKVIDDAVEQTGETYPSIDEAAAIVREWQDARRPK